jgi:hypothetical protein
VAPVSPGPPTYYWNGAYAQPAPLLPVREPPRTAFNALYVELLGAGVIYSLNYDRMFGDFSARVGVGYYSSSDRAYSSDGRTYDVANSFLAVPLSVSYLGIGSKQHIFELGAGLTVYRYRGSRPDIFFDTSDGDTGVIGVGTIGYRLQPLNGGFFLRAGVNPLLGARRFLPLPYISLGATF